jgi:hypothetical protein
VQLHVQAPVERRRLAVGGAAVLGDVDACEVFLGPVVDPCLHPL